MAICSRRMLLAAGALLLGGCAAVNLHPGDFRSIDAWGVSFLPTLRNGALDPVPAFDGQTLRVVVLSKLAGTKARVKLTNRFQTAQLQIGAARIALREGARGGAIVVGTDRALSFAGQASVTLEPGEERWSDPVEPRGATSGGRGDQLVPAGG